jgi:hypothetical protein
VPQAVGIAPDGLVVFGWCLACLADRDCRLVEVSATGLHDLDLNAPETAAEPDVADIRTLSVRLAPDQSRWLVALVGFLLVAWGLAVFVTGLLGKADAGSGAGTAPPRAESLLGNGNPSLLRVGGGVSTLVGLSLLIVGARPGRALLAKGFVTLRWGAFVAAMGVLGSGVLRYNPHRNLLLLIVAASLLMIAWLARWFERLLGREAVEALASSADFPVVCYAPLVSPLDPKPRKGSGADFL